MKNLSIMRELMFFAYRRSGFPANDTLNLFQSNHGLFVEVGAAMLALQRMASSQLNRGTDGDFLRRRHRVPYHHRLHGILLPSVLGKINTT